jgi:hypothetical protein
MSTTKDNGKFVHIPARAIAAVAKWASKDSRRPHIQMVLFAESEYVATDGHRMVIAPYEVPSGGSPYGGKPFGVDAAHLLAAVAAKQVLPRDEMNLAIVPSENGGQLKIWLDGRRVGPALLVPECDPTSYPPYRKVIPSKPDDGTDSPEGYGLDMHYLAAIAEVNEATGCRGAKVTAWSKDQLGPIALVNEAGVKFAIMPMRM